MPKHDDDVEIPSMMLDADEVKPRRQLHDEEKSSPVIQSVQGAQPIPTAAVEVRTEKPNLSVIYLLLGLILILTAVFAYFMWSQNQQLKSELQGQIQNLDSQLIAVDASAAEQGLTIEETLKKHDSEIRKLWGVSYDINRKAIKKNTDQVAALTKTQSNQTKSYNALEKKLTQQLTQQDTQQAKLVAAQKTLTTSLSKLEKETVVSLKNQQTAIEKQAKTLAATVKQQASKIDVLLKDLAELEDQNTKSTAKLNMAEKTLKEVNKAVAAVELKLKNQLGNARPGDLEIQVQDHQEAIDSIDAYRVQVNNKLNRLETHVNQLLLQSQVE